MQNISSSTTVFLKYFLPTIWIIFFGTLFVAFWLNDEIYVLGFAPEKFKWIYMGFLIVGVVLLYLTVMTIKRVEIDEEFVYVTNYIKVYKYPFSNIESWKELDYGLFKTVKIRLKEPGYFGKKIVFIASRERYSRFFEEHPSIVQKIING